MAIGIFNDLTAFSVIRAKINSLINIIDGTTPASDIQVPAANVVGAGTAATANTGTSAGDVPTVAQADVRYSAAAHVHDAAAAGVAGFMSGADKVKLDGVEAGAQVNVGTNLNADYSPFAVNLVPSTGVGVDVNPATSVFAGVMAAADKVKLDGVEAGAQVNVGTNLNAGYSPFAVNLVPSTGVGVDVNPATSVFAGVMAAADKVKLDSIAPGAQVNPATTASRADPSGTTVLQAAAMNDHRVSADHDGRYALIGAAWPGVYGGTDVNNITFPIGTPLMLNSRNRSRNSTVVPRLAVNSAQYIDSGTGAILTGVWALRGDTIYDDHGQLIQRIS